jgi:hypothetical protein
MRTLSKIVWIGLWIFCVQSSAVAEEAMLDAFENQPEKRWDFFADTVMGGVSSGQVRFIKENGSAHARMTGQVSIENRGGFIQLRKTLSEKPSDNAKGVRLVVRGNGQRYFVHLRTSGTMLPWQYCQGGFDSSEDWAEVRIPLSEFKPSGRILRSELRAGSVKSVGIVAYGRDHQADIRVQEIGFYY